MTVMAAYSPADAMPSQLMRKPWNAVIPAFFAVMPSANDTARYPSPMGAPSRIPRRKALFPSLISHIPPRKAKIARKVNTPTILHPPVDSKRRGKISTLPRRFYKNSLLTAAWGYGILIFQ